ncbi:AraC family transcriptional regulator [Paenibacillus cremeus]|uniref:AraC family transcriptional regulator n=1 Tax=Paenibacillus cremeus TaxID=2163881 RepID=UPI001644DF95|nr:AraC family transcriptional regulator [Paenibacillus cremeus]
MFAGGYENDWFLFEGEIHVHTIGRIVATNLHPNRTLPFWVLGVVVSGQRTIQVGERQAYLTAGDFFILPPHIPHQGIERDKHDAFFVHFDVKGRAISPPAGLHADEIRLPMFGNIPTETDILRSFAYTHNQFSTGRVGQPFVHSQFLSMFYQISLYMQKKRAWANVRTHLGDEILEYISLHLAEPMNYQSFEHHFQLSYRQLNTIFKKQIQSTIRQKIIELRIDHALNLLMQGETIAYAAEHSGFSDYFYFLKCFKKGKGLSPKELQKKYIAAGRDTRDAGLQPALHPND